MTSLSLPMLSAALLLLFPSPALSLSNGLINTPPMGWSSWNRFHCAINESVILQIAGSIRSSGLLSGGYQYLNLDDCWMDAQRNASGFLVGDRETFPSGMKALGQQLHAQGFLYGLYLDPGTLTCQRRPGSFGYETKDAQFLAEAGADYLKHDACYSTAEEQLYVYFTMRDALNATGRKIGYSICPMDARCNDPTAIMWDASSVANVNMCRGDGICRDAGLADRPTDILSRKPARSSAVRRAPSQGRGSEGLQDIIPTWHSWLCMLDVQAQFNSMKYAGPGHYVMPDMLEVGNGMTVEEDRSHFSMWAMIAAPLIMGHDVRTQSQETLQLLLNEEIIAINQDPMGKPAVRNVQQGGYDGFDVWTRQLSSGDYAMALLNRNNVSATNITVNFAFIGLPPSQPAALRDLWTHKDLGVFNGSFTALVQPHQIVVLKAHQMPTTHLEL